MSTPVPGDRWLATLEEQARAVLAPALYEYFRQGSRDGAAALDAVGSWASYRLTPRVFADVREVDLASTLVGGSFTAPVGIAPSTLQQAADPGGEVAMSTAAARAGVPVVVSSNATASFAAIGATGATWWLQAYVPQRRDLAVPMLEAAVATGAAAVVLTVDTPVVGTKYDGAVWGSVPDGWVRANLGSAADAPKARDLGPSDVAWLHRITGLPVVTKGILHPDDAAAAVIAGAAAVWVSNHGGRQLSRAISTADALAPVAARIAGAVPVIVDGGVRSGMDVLTALALGADAVFLGRLPLYALAVDGAPGVSRMLTDLLTELREGLVLSGCRSVTEVRNVVVSPAGTTPR